MRIGLDATPLLRPGTGIAVYTEQLARALARERPSDQFILVCNRPIVLEDPRLPPNLNVHAAQEGPRSPTLWVLSRAGREARRLGLALFHFTNNANAPLAMPCPFLVTLHGLAPLTHPECYPCKTRLLARAWWPLAVRRAGHVLALTQRSAEEIRRRYGIPGERMSVTPLAPAPVFVERHWDREGLAALRARYRLPQRFILNVATWQPIKNHGRLLAAYAAALERRTFPHGLVLAGPAGWGSPPCDPATLPPGLRDRVQVLGRVPQEDLSGLYRLADFFLYPSLYEAFCLPNLEAMASRTPVLTSAVPAISDVVGSAALQADPLSVDRLADAILAMAGAPPLRDNLRQRGQEHVRDFSWRRTAAETWAAYEKVMGGAHAN